MRAPGSGNLAFWMAGIVIAGGVAIGAAWYASRSPAPQDATAPPPPAPETPAPETPGAAPDKASGTGPESEAPQETAEAEPEATFPAAPLPRLQELRLESDGLAVIAGQVSPFADVILRLDGSEIARASADGTGAFATMATLQPSDAARVLTLSQLDGAGGEITSPDEMILAPARIPEPETAEASAGTDLGSESPEAAEDAPATQVVARTDAATDAAQAAPDPPVEDAAPGIAAESGDAFGDASGDAAPDATIDDTPSGQESVDGTTTASVTFDRDPSDPADAEMAAPPPDDSTVATVAASGDAADPGATDAPPDSAPPDSAPPDSAPAPELAAVAPDALRPAAPTAAETTPTVEAVAPAARTPPAIPPPAAPGQVAILRSNEEGVRVVRPADPQPGVMSQVALDSISYSAQGEVELQGRAQDAAQQVRVYLDNRPVASLDVDASGSWRGALPQVDTGVYTLRIDELDAAGRVTSRVETPFKREAPEVLAAATQDTTARVAAVTVQRGDTLWAISRDRYGEGILYVRVFEANRDSIRDPDLIYPGQIFTLPAE